jgi:FkbM family methyltransferase
MRLPKPVRSFALKILKTFNPGTITITHHYTGKKIRLDFFKHKGYWYYGKARERETMDLFELLITKGDHVVEVGAHIGYITQYFSHLVGPTGHVYIFEPGENNLPFTIPNVETLGNVTLTKKAVSNFEGEAVFYVENLTGQNNSLLKDYSIFSENVSRVSLSFKQIESKVQVTTLDRFVSSNAVNPRLIKIDIEGAELQAIEGAIEVIRSHHPAIMVEVTENYSKVFETLAKNDYLLFTPERMPLTNAGQDYSGNVFCIWAHDERIRTFLGERS